MKVNLDMLQTVALATVVYYFGLWVKNKVRLLDKFCIPAPVVGGIIFAVLNLILRQNNLLTINLDGTLQKPFMMVFFTTIGLGANLKLIKIGGKHVATFFIVSVLLVISQDLLGVGLSKMLNVNPLLGLISSSITMVGGHGTGAAFGAMFEKNYGFNGAVTAAMAAATFGLIMGSLIGGPIAKTLVEKHNLKSDINTENSTSSNNSEKKYEVNYSEMFRMFMIIMISIGLGAILEKGFETLHVTLPSYINTMIIASIILNLGEFTGKWEINEQCTEILGHIGLNVFLSMALINLKLWELKDIAGPMLIILIGQTILMAVFAYFISFRLCGKDYDSAVISSGFCGFGMGATPNGMANMDAMVSKYGPAPRAFFVLPIVGAFFIDFANSIIITIFVNFLK